MFSTMNDNIAKIRDAKLETLKPPVKAKITSPSNHLISHDKKQRKKTIFNPHAKT